MDKGTRTTWMIFFVCVFLCLGVIGCGEQAAKPGSAGIRTQSKQTKKASASNEDKKAAAKAKREAKEQAKAERQAREKARKEIAKAKREAKEKAKAEAATAKREAKLRANREVATAKRERKQREAERLNAKREAAQKTKREAAARAKAKRQEKARREKQETMARKWAKDEIAKAKKQKQTRLAALDAKARKQAKNQAKRTKTEKAQLARRFEADKARLAAGHKKAKTSAGKERAKSRAEQARTIKRLETEHKNTLAELDKKAKAQTDKTAKAGKALSARLDTRVKNIDAERAQLKRRFKANKARLAAEQKKAKANAKKETAKSRTESKRTIKTLGAEYKDAVAPLNIKSEQLAAQSVREKRQKKNELTRLDARAKKQAKDIKGQKTGLKKNLKKDKASLAADNKKAKAKAPKKQHARLDAEYKRAVSRLDSAYKQDLAELNRKAKSQRAQIAGEKRKTEAAFARSNTETKKQAKETEAEKARLKDKLAKDKAQAKKYRTAKLDDDYKQKLSQLKADHNKALAQLDQKAKTQKAQAGEARRQIKAELAELDAKAKTQAEEIKAEKKRLNREFAQGKAEARMDAQAKLDAEYKQKLVQFKADYRDTLTQIDEKSRSRKTEVAQQKQQIEAEYEEAVAKADLKLRYHRDKRQAVRVTLPDDTTSKMTVKEIRISGNTLISTAQILENMPAVYNASDKPLEKAQSTDLYDLRVIHDIILEPGQPREVSARTIQGLTRYVLSVYQDSDYAGIYVYVPVGAVNSGKLKGEILPIEVLEAPVTDVTVKTYDPDQNETEKGYLDKSAVLQWSPVKDGEVANQKQLDDFVNLLNLNPDRYVSAVVTKGAKPESLAVQYDIYEADPWHWFAQIDNSGTDDRQWSPRIGLINTNLLGIDDTFTTIFQGKPDSTIDDTWAIYGSYDFPIAGPRLRLNAYGGYSEFDISPEAGVFDFLGRGTFYGGILKYNLCQFDNWFLDLKGSLEHTDSRVNSRFFGLLLQQSNVKFWLWGAGVDLHRSDDMSDTYVTAEQFSSLGGESDAADFSAARTNSDSLFTIYNVIATHSQYLDGDKVQRLSTSFRWTGSNERLVPAKMTSFGGMYSVRGYDEYEVVADGGILASSQYEFDLVKHQQGKQGNKTASEQTPAKSEPQLKKFAPLVFVDYGRTTIRHPLVGLNERDHVTMFSVGTGAIVEIGDNFTGAVYYGVPLRKTNETNKWKGRINVGLLYRW